MGHACLMWCDVMYEYEMDPASILKDTEQTPFCPQTDRLTDMVKPVYPLSNSVEVGVKKWYPIYKQYMHVKLGNADRIFYDTNKVFEQ